MPKVPDRPAASATTNGATKEPLRGKKKRKARQSTKERYAKAREDAQVQGVISTVPEGAVRDERVDPLSQDEQKFPGLDRLAIRNDGKGWSVPEHIKRKVIETSAEVLFEKRTVTSPVTGETIEVPPDRFVQMQAAKTLMQADKQQWERDNPEEAGKAAGGGDTNVQVVELSELLKRAKEQREVKPEVIDVKPPQAQP